MTSPTAPPSLTTAPDFPALSDRSAGTYNSKAFTWAQHWGSTGGPQVKALADNAYTNAQAASEAATTASSAKTDAQAAQAAAESASAATKWVSGATYAEGTVKWSPVDFASYRRKTAGAGTTDPSADSTNWQRLGATPTPIAADLTLAKEAVLTLASSIGSSVSGLAAVALDATRELLVLYGSSSVHALVYDSSAGSFGAPVLLRTASSAIAKGALVATDKVLVVTLPSSSTAMETVVLTTSGTTITVGTPVATTLAANSQAYDSDKLFALGSAWVFEYSNNAAAPCLRAITVSGTTPTVGSELTLSGLYGGPSFAVTSSVALIIRASNSQLFATPVSLSGTTLTAGTQATATTTSYQGVCGVALSSGRYAVAYQNSAVFGGIVSVSGTTATISTVNFGFGGVGTATDMALIAVGSQAIVGASNAVNVLTDSSGTAVAGTAITTVGAAFGYTATALLMNRTNLRGAYSAIGISGNNPAFTYTHLMTFDNTATVGQFESWRQGNPQIAHLTLRTAAGKHVAVNASNAAPFALSVTSGSPTVRAWMISPGSQAFKSSSESAVWGFTLGAGTAVTVRKVEAV